MSVKKMRPYTRKLKQWAVYWAPSGAGVDGKTTYAEGVEIKCRWESSTEQTIDKNGNTIVSKAEVNPDRELSPDGVLWEGRKSELTSATDPFAQPGAWPIQRFDRTPNAKATKVWYSAIL